MKELTDGQLVRVARKIHGLSLKEMGKLLMCGEGHVAQIERGARKLTEIRKDRILKMLLESSSWYLDMLRAMKRYFKNCDEWYDETRKLLDTALGIRRLNGDLTVNEDTNRRDSSYG